MKFGSCKTGNIALKLVFVLIFLSIIPISYAVDVASCQTLSTANAYYRLIQNVSSSSTCFVIGADNVTLDGQGYWINYSQSVTGYAVDDSGGFDNITLKNLNIVQEDSSVSGAYAISSFGMTNSTISNNTITTSGSTGIGIYLFSNNTNNNISGNTITTSGSDGWGIFLQFSSTSNNISGNTITTSGDTGYGVNLQTSSGSNTISSNNITTSGNSYSIGIRISASDSNIISGNTVKTFGSDGNGMNVISSNSNNFSDNIIITSNASAYGIFLNSASFNDITGGSIISKASYDYYLQNTLSNKFINTNFTAQRAVYFADTNSKFNYNNETNGNIWLNTSVSNPTSLNRTLAKWNSSAMRWNDTASIVGITSTYSITGLLSNTEYKIYNASAGTKTKAYTLTTDSGGNLPSFTIALNGNTEISVMTTSISSCQELDLPETYTLTANVSSADTCFTIKSDNVVLDGQGYTINYSQSATGNAVDNSGGYNNITIKNLNIMQGNSTPESAHAIYGSGMEDSTISNSTIRTSGNYSGGVFFNSSRANILANSTIITSGNSSNAILLKYSNDSKISDNNITLSGTFGAGIYIWLSSTRNSFENNAVVAESAGSYGAFVNEAQAGENNITGGSITAKAGYDYYLNNAGSGNNFTNTNFTAQRKVYITGSSSWFNYRNDTSTDIWLKTTTSAEGSINRTLVIWSQSTMKWNDTNSTAGIVATYNITGLWINVNYSIYNTSFGIQTNLYNLTADAAGNLPGFNITLNGNTEIFLNKTENAAPEIALNSPSDMSWSTSRTISHQFTPGDDAGFGNCSVWSNNTGAWGLMQANTSAILNSNLNTISAAYSSDGDFLWGIQCYDNGAPPLSSFSTTNRTVRIDSTPPNITLLSPANSSTWASSSTVLFEYNVSDAVSIANCSLLVNEAVSENDTTVAKDVKQNFTKTLSNGNYNWSVSCYDYLGNQGSSGTYQLLVNYTPPPSCSDGIQNQDETDVDCGGSCPACEGGGGGGGDQNLTSLTVRPSWAVTKVYVKFKSSITNPSLSVIRLSNVSVAAPSDSVYQYFSITASNFEDSDIESATIDFKVNTSWIDSETISSISLARYTDSWNKLTTTYVNSSGGYDYYISYPGGFSYFAILGERAGAPPAPPADSGAPSTPPVSPGNISNGTQDGIALTKEGGIGWLAIPLIFLAILAAGAYIYYKYGGAANVLKELQNLVGGRKNTSQDSETDYLIKRMSEVKKNIGWPKGNMVPKGMEEEYLAERLKEARKKLGNY